MSITMVKTITRNLKAKIKKLNRINPLKLAIFKTHKPNITKVAQKRPIWLSTGVAFTSWINDGQYVDMYCKTACTSMGGIVTQDNHETQLIINPVATPCVNCAKRVVPPAIGNNVESSANVNAIMIVANPPNSQEIIAADPAILAE